MNASAKPRRRGRLARWAALLLVVPLLVNAAVPGRDSETPWFQQRRDSAGLAPDPASTPEAVIQVYAARAVGWRGIFAVHTWIAVKPTGAARFTRYEVIGFGVSRGLPAVTVDRTGPDNYWFGAEPQLVLDRRGPGIDGLIERVHALARDYPFPASYRAWPGPNSNTFTAHVGREIPELRLDLPSNAIGKDFLSAGVIGRAPSGTGWQLSILGVLGLLAAREEGLEVNLLGLSLGVDFDPPALKLPGLGRIGMARAPAR